MKLSLPNCNIILCSFCINNLGSGQTRSTTGTIDCSPHPSHFQAAEVTNMSLTHISANVLFLYNILHDNYSSIEV